MLKRLHAIAGGAALIMISGFWLASLAAEILGSAAAITAVKTGILFGLALLIPAMITAGASGTYLGRNWRLPVVSKKTNRMKLVAANGLFVLVPSAVFLANKAWVSQFDAWFYAVQLLELAAGATNVWLLGLNMRDGLRLSNRKKPNRAGA